jgi:hypothetical protein
VRRSFAFYSGRGFRRPRVSTVIAVIALVFAMTGGAVASTVGPTAAASKAAGNAPKNEGKQDLAQIKGFFNSHRAGLRGPAGPTGATGPQGSTGNTGATGPQGPKGDTGAAGPQGAQGPQGPQGATGPQGPAGAARDVGSVYPGDASTPASFRPEGLKGWVSVTRVGTGSYCLRPDASITLGNAVVLVSLGNNGGAGPGSAAASGVCSFSPLEYSVRTWNASGAAADQNFTAIIP